MIPLVCTVLGAAGILRLMLGLYRLGVADGDQSTDARSRIECRGANLQVSITNPGPTPVTVGVTLRGRLGGLAERCDVVRARTSRRMPRRSEYRRADRGAAEFLGVVDSGEERSWSLPCPPVPARVRLIFGQGDDRLRVHDHLLAAAS